MHTKETFILKILCSFGIVLLFWYASFTIIDPDVWWHLTVGEQILQNREIPQFDRFTHTMLAYQWVDHEWLTDVIFFKLYTIVPWFVLSFICAFFAAIPFLVWIQRSRSFMFSFLVVLAAIALVDFLGVRPQIVSFFFFFVLLDVLYRRYSEHEESLWFWLLPVLFFVWANMHGSFFGGLGAYAIALMFGKRLPCLEYLMFGLCIVVTILTPYGLGLYTEVFRTSSSAYISQYIDEWQPAFLKIGTGFSLYIGAVLAAGVMFYRFIPMRMYMIAGAFLIFFMRSVKMGPFFLIASLPLLYGAFLHIPVLNKRIPLFLCALTLGAYGLFTAHNIETMSFPSEGALDALREQRVGELFNLYGWGGYLIYHAREIPVFIDGRMPHWGGERSAMRDYVNVHLGREGGWREVFRKRGVRTVFMKSFATSEYKEEYAVQRTFSKFGFHVPDLIAQVDLVSELKSSGWEEVYNDGVAIMLRCMPNTRCEISLH